MRTKFLCVQPISIRLESVKDVFYKMKQPKDILKFSLNKVPEWIKKVKILNNSMYDDLFVLELPYISNKLLKKDIPLYLQDFLILEETMFYLLFDKKTHNFTLCYELVFKFDLNGSKEKDIFLNSDSPFYLDMRNLIVREEQESDISEWSLLIEYNVRNTIQTFLYENYDYNIAIKDILIIPNTGNITNLVDLIQEYDSGKIIDIEKITNLFIQINKNSDRFENQVSLPIYLNKNDRYYFAGRFHTITITNAKNLNRFQPIQYQIQINWFYALELTKTFNYFNELIYSDNFNYSFEDKKRFVNFLISEIMVFETKDEIFKTYLENNKNLIYDEIEKKWNVDKILIRMFDYVKEYKSYLEDAYKKEKEEFESLSRRSRTVLLAKIHELHTEKKVLEDTVTKDYLTGAYNRKKLFLDLESSKDKKMILSFVDIDDFKKINDTYGHQFGDVVLEQLVTTVNEFLINKKLNGKFYRYGGEEFILTIFDSKVNIKEDLDLLRKCVEDKKYVIDNNKNFFCTISQGVVLKHEDDDYNIKLKEADILLYKAKTEGKNNIIYDF